MSFLQTRTRLISLLVNHLDGLADLEIPLTMRWTVLRRKGSADADASVSGSLPEDVVVALPLAQPFPRCKPTRGGHPTVALCHYWEPLVTCSTCLLGAAVYTAIVHT